ncbi:prestin-like [Littorina saxatilis]|uniref:STAS domain-containing protein n=1 Tax=Littorina saxatilis TaxID=31220 RepID=A0AAN9B5W6_9CAEN
MPVPSDTPSRFLQQRESLSSATAQGMPQLVVTSRRCYTQDQLDEAYTQTSVPLTLGAFVKDQCRCSASTLKKKLFGFFPIFSVLKNYNWRFKFAMVDVINGFSVGFLHLPQGLGFGLLASLKPVHGLYSSFFPVLVYMVFGTSPHVSMGTNAVVALLAASVIDSKVQGLGLDKGGNHTMSEEELLHFKVGVAGASCFIGGLLLIAMGLLRMGFLTNFMAKSFIGGFSFAAAVHITMSQLVKLLHLKIPSRTGMGKLVFTTIDVCKNIADTNAADVIVGLISAVILLGVSIGVNQRYKHRLKIPIPIELIVVVLSTFVSHFADLKRNFGLDVVGDIPQGMPAPSIPPFDLMPSIIKESVITAILIFALTISMAKLTAKLHDITIDDNQELVAYGMCNLVGAFFQNFSSSISPPRTMMLSAMRSRSTLNGVTSAVFILLVLLVAGQLFVSLPIAMLSAMIVAAMKDLLFQVTILKQLWYINKSDFFIWLLTAVCSVFGDLDIGLLVGVVVSMVTVLIVSQLAKGTLLGKSSYEDLIIDLDRRGIFPFPGVTIFRFESQLHFASAERFKSEMYRKVCDPTTSTRKDCYEIDVDEQTDTARANLQAETHKTLSGRDGLALSPGIDFPSKDVVNDVDHLRPSGVGIRRENSEESAVDKSMVQVVPPDVQQDGKAEDGQLDVEVHGGKDVQGEGRLLVQEGEGTDPAKQHDRTNNAPLAIEKDDKTASLTTVPMAPDSLSDISHVILDCSTMTYIDITGVDTLHLIITQFSRAGVSVLLTDIPPTTLGILTRAKFFEHEDHQRVHHSVLDALIAIRATRSQRKSTRKSFADFGTTLES